MSQCTSVPYRQTTDAGRANSARWLRHCALKKSVHAVTCKILQINRKCDKFAAPAGCANGKSFSDTALAIARCPPTPNFVPTPLEVGFGFRNAVSRKQLDRELWLYYPQLRIVKFWISCTYCTLLLYWDHCNCLLGRECTSCCEVHWSVIGNSMQVETGNSTRIV